MDLDRIHFEKYLVIMKKKIIFESYTITKYVRLKMQFKKN